MRKDEIPNAPDNRLIVDYVRSYSQLVSNMQLGRGVKRLSDHVTDLERELVKRRILTEEDIKSLE